MAKLLVTGGAGFIGSHCCLVLLKAGYEIIVLDSFVNSSIISLHRISRILNINLEARLKIIKGDIRDITLLRKIFLEEKSKSEPISGVIHFAGLKAVGESVINPLEYWDVNVNGSRVLFKVMDEFTCRTIVFSSSATIYGLPDSVPINEKSALNPINPYGRTKSTVESILNDLYFSNKDKWKIANLRYFNPVGAHSSGFIGEDPKDIPNNIFPIICQVASGKREKIRIFGDDWPTEDGTGIRDYIHVMDLVEGHFLALRYLAKSNPQIVAINLGTGHGASVLNLISTFSRVNDIEIPYEIVSRRDGDVAISIADPSLAENILGWRAKRNLEEMCKDGWNWQLNNLEGYK
tara:strand:- start:5904 stop:6950 length:1047 start_codon:yes stop_codon:yes gene_type:complete